VIRDIAGRQNRSVKLARKLQQKKHRREHGLMLCEGMDLLGAAVQAGAQIREVLIRRDLLGELPKSLVDSATGDVRGERTPDIGVCDQATLEYASSLGGSADVIFTCVQPRWSLGDLALGGGVSFYVDGAGDPGNVGTIVRSGVAFGLVGVMCSVGTADSYCPKAMRAGMGAQFLLPVVVDVLPEDLRAWMAGLRERGDDVPEIVVADPYAGDDVRGAMGSRGLVVVLGSERGGPREDWAEAARVAIPQKRFDSLNVAMAGTIIAYEIWRSDRASCVGN
jgi:TrmH family RNA methyltransferase